MSITKDDLMAFQEFLMDIFYTYNNVPLIQQKFSSSFQNPRLLNWLSSLDPDMLEVAARMVQHWGIKG